jgi:Sec-independent protein translocase protein TatA
VKKCSENTLGKSIKEFKKTAPNSEKHPHTAAALAKVPQASSESVIEKEEKPDSETQKEEQKPRAHDP